MIDLREGDCLELMRDIPDGSINMVLCDLPYGVTQAKWDVPIDMNALWREYLRCVKENGAILLFSMQPFTTDLINSNRKLFRYEIIWEKSAKGGFLNAKRMPLRGHENILVFYRKQPVYNPQMKRATGKPRRYHGGKTKSELYGDYKGKYYTDDGMRYPSDVIQFGNSHGAPDNRFHQTQKPVPLLEYLIRTYTNKGDTVLDNTMGSGSTGVACIHTGRNFIGIEKEHEYMEIARKRCEGATEEMKQMSMEEFME